MEISSNWRIIVKRQLLVTVEKVYLDSFLSLPFSVSLPPSKIVQDNLLFSFLFHSLLPFPLLHVGSDLQVVIVVPSSFLQPKPSSSHTRPWHHSALTSASEPKQEKGNEEERDEEPKSPQRLQQCFTLVSAIHPWCWW